MINFRKLIPTAAFLLAFLSCTTLDEEVLDESLTGTGQAEIVSGSIAPVYGMLRQVWLHTVNFGLQEVASDEAILPYRGGTDWFDGGKFIAVHQHLMTPTNSLVGDSWTFITLTLSRAVAAEEQLKLEVENGNTSAQNPLYEMVAMKAYLNMLALDNWGLVFKKNQSSQQSEILRREAAVEYLESELLSVVNLISSGNGPGRMNKHAVEALLARLYLNAAVYRDPYGTPNFNPEDMDKVIEYTTNIINAAIRCHRSILIYSTMTTTPILKSSFPWTSEEYFRPSIADGNIGLSPETRSQGPNFQIRVALMRQPQHLRSSRLGMMPTATWILQKRMPVSFRRTPSFPKISAT
ncbi:hypothetical protein [Algoriphagus boritolerans]|uniref:hypothetical protein n=1 Tax=Algoriphagus boritolerans TaxID=308111 RepID=UPI000AA5BB2A